MTDSVNSNSEKVNNGIISGLADDNYLLDKIVSIKRNIKVSRDDIKYLVKNSEPGSQSRDAVDVDDIVNKAVNNIIEECENDLSSNKIPQNYPVYESTDFTEKLLNSNITLDNYEEIFILNSLKSVELPFSGDEKYRCIRYKDDEGTTLAIAQINRDNSKIRLQTFGGVLPKQQFVTPQQVNYRVMSKANAEHWSTEYGGVNQFDGSIEIRYKNAENKVMAAVIFKADGNVDTVVEYQYVNNKKSQMLHTSQFGHSKTIYDEVKDTTKLIIDIDTDGNICCVTREFN